MTEALKRIGLVLLLAMGASAAFAQEDGEEADDTLLGEELILFPDLWLPGPGTEGRKDVRAVTMPPPPSGPATPVPYCGPSSPVCP